LLAAAIGFGSLLAIYGVGFVFGTSSYWHLPALQDHRMYMMGYRYFLYAPWHWPLFETHTNMPFTRSAAFSDTPLAWALVHKAIATIITPYRDYSASAFLGLWYALASTLQAVFGVAILRALGHRSWSTVIAASAFFIAIPAWTYRFPHAALYAHFVILWALYLYLITPTERPAALPLRVGQLGQLAVAALIQPYHTVMSLAVFAASLLRAPGRRSAPGWLALACLIVCAELALAGYFAGEAATSVRGFPAAGSNLLAPVMPVDAGWIGAGAWVDPTGLQYEGTCYLGLGILVLVTLTRPRDAIAAIRRHAALTAIAMATAVFALSNHVYFGSHEVLAYRIPRPLHWIPDQFRCPGRFSWLPMYLVVIFVLSRGLSRLATGWKRLVVPALAVVQLVDVTPDWRRWRHATEAPTETPLDLGTWEKLLASVDEIDAAPAHDCNSDRSFDLATQVEYLASAAALPVNGVYTARPWRDCDRDIASLLDFHPTPRTLYVFYAPMLGLARRLAATGLPCAEAGAMEVCDLDRALIESTGWPTTPPPATLSVGQPIELANPAASYLELGWASAEPNGRWTDGPVARLVFRLTGPPPADPRLFLEASAMLCGARIENDVDVAIAGEPLGTLHFDASSNALAPARALRIARRELLAHRIVEVELRPHDIRSPRDLGCRPSTRQIAIKVRRVWIEGAPSE
jgi:hypothetical protein